MKIRSYRLYSLHKCDAIYALVDTMQVNVHVAVKSFFEKDENVECCKFKTNYLKAKRKLKNDCMPFKVTMMKIESFRYCFCTIIMGHCS